MQELIQRSTDMELVKYIIFFKINVNKISLEINFHEATGLHTRVHSPGSITEGQLSPRNSSKMLSTAHCPQNASKPTQQTQTAHTTTPSESRLYLGILGNILPTTC